MNVLFVGGTGIISSACARAALSCGMDVTFLCRGKTQRHPVPPGATVLRGDVRDPASARAALGDRTFAAVLGRAAGVTPQLAHVPSELIAAYDPEWGASLLGDKAHSMVFDNAKVKKLVPDFRAITPYAHAAEEQVAWYDADDRRRVVDDRLNATIDRILAGYSRAWPDRR